MAKETQIKINSFCNELDEAKRKSHIKGLSDKNLADAILSQNALMGSKKPLEYVISKIPSKTEEDKKQEREDRIKIFKELVKVFKDEKSKLLTDNVLDSILSDLDLLEAYVEQGGNFNPYTPILKQATANNKEDENLNRLSAALYSAFENRVKPSKSTFLDFILRDASILDRKSGNNFLHDAIKSGNDTAVKWFLNIFDNQTDMSSENKEQLEYILNDTNLEQKTLIQILLDPENKLEKDAKDELLKILVKRGAEVNDRSSLKYVIENTDKDFSEDVCSNIQSNNDLKQLFLGACSAENKEDAMKIAIDTMNKNPELIYTSSDDDKASLFLAAESGNFELVHAIINKHKEEYQKKRKGREFIHKACSKIIEADLINEANVQNKETLDEVLYFSSEYNDKINQQDDLLELLDNNNNVTDGDELSSAILKRAVSSGIGIRERKKQDQKIKENLESKKHKEHITKPEEIQSELRDFVSAFTSGDPKYRLESILKQKGEAWCDISDKDTGHNIATACAAFTSSNPVETWKSLNEAFQDVDSGKRGKYEVNNLINLKTPLGTPLMVAVKYGNEALALSILRQGKDIIDYSIKDSNDVTLVQAIVSRALETGRTDVLKQYIENRPNDFFRDFTYSKNPNRNAIELICESENNKNVLDVWGVINDQMRNLSSNQLRDLLIKNNSSIIYLLAASKNTTLAKWILSFASQKAECSLGNAKTIPSEEEKEQRPAEIAAKKGSKEMLLVFSENKAIPDDCYDNVIAEFITNSDFDPNILDKIVSNTGRAWQGGSNPAAISKAIECKSIKALETLCGIGNIYTHDRFNEVTLSDGKPALYHVIKTRDLDFISNVLKIKEFECKFYCEGLDVGSQPLIAAFKVPELAPLCENLLEKDEVRKFVQKNYTEVLMKVVESKTTNLLEKVLAFDNAEPLNHAALLKHALKFNKENARLLLREIKNSGFSDEYVKSLLNNVASSIEGVEFDVMYGLMTEELDNALYSDFSSVQQASLSRVLVSHKQKDQLSNLALRAIDQGDYSCLNVLASDVNDGSNKSNLSTFCDLLTKHVNSLDEDKRYDIKQEISNIAKTIPEPNFIILMKSIISNGEPGELTRMLEARNQIPAELDWYVLSQKSDELIDAYSQAYSKIYNQDLDWNRSAECNTIKPNISASLYHPDIVKSIHEARLSKSPDDKEAFYKSIKQDLIASLNSEDAKRVEFLGMFSKSRNQIGGDKVSAFIDANSYPLVKHYHNTWDKEYISYQQIKSCCDAKSLELKIDGRDGLFFNEKESKIIKKALESNSRIMGFDSTIMNRIIKYSDYETMKTIVSEMDPNVIVDNQGNTLMHKIFEKSSDFPDGKVKELVDILVERGALLNVKNVEGKLASELCEDMSIKSVLKEKAGGQKETFGRLVDAYMKFEQGEPRQLEHMIKSMSAEKGSEADYYIMSEIVEKSLLKCFEYDVKTDSGFKTRDDMVKSAIRILNVFAENNNTPRAPHSNVLHKFFNQAVEYSGADKVNTFNMMLDQMYQYDKLGSLNISKMMRAVDNFGKSPIEELHRINNVECYDKACYIIGGNSAVHDICDVQRLFISAAFVGNYDLCEALLNRYSKVIKVNGVTSDGRVPILEAALNGKVDTVNKLLEIGANFDATIDNKGNTILHSLLSNIGQDNNSEVRIQIALNLISKGADLTRANKSGDTPMKIMNDIVSKADKFISRYDSLMSDVKKNIKDEDLIARINSGFQSNVFSYEIEEIKKSLDEKYLDDNVSEIQELENLYNMYGSIYSESKMIDSSLEVCKGALETESNFEIELEQRLAENRSRIAKIFRPEATKKIQNVRIYGGTACVTLNSNNNEKAKLNMGKVIECQNAKDNGIKSCFTDFGGGDSATLQVKKIKHSGKDVTVKNYIVHTGSITLTLNGNEGKPKGLKVVIDHAGGIRLHKKSRHLLDRIQESEKFTADLSHLHVGGIKLRDALLQGYWHKNEIPKSKKADQPEKNNLQNESDVNLDKGKSESASEKINVDQVENLVDALNDNTEKGQFAEDQVDLCRKLINEINSDANFEHDKELINNVMQGDEMNLDNLLANKDSFVKLLKSYSKYKEAQDVEENLDQKLPSIEGEKSDLTEERNRGGLAYSDEHEGNEPDSVKKMRGKAEFDAFLDEIAPDESVGQSNEFADGVSSEDRSSVAAHLKPIPGVNSVQEVGDGAVLQDRTPTTKSASESLGK